MTCMIINAEVDMRDPMDDPEYFEVDQVLGEIAEHPRMKVKFEELSALWGDS